MAAKGRAAYVTPLIIEALIADLTDRRGLRQEWDNIDDEIQQEIKDEWAEKIKAILTSNGAE